MFIRSYYTSQAIYYEADFEPNEINTKVIIKKFLRLTGTQSKYNEDAGTRLLQFVRRIEYTLKLKIKEVLQFH